MLDRSDQAENEIVKDQETAARPTDRRQMDMLYGSLWDKILLFALPLAASSILQQLFNSADVAVVGNFAGSNALAAVGSNGAVIAVFVNLFVGLSVGANVVSANLIGQKKTTSVPDVVHTAMTFSIGGFFFPAR